MGAADHWLLSPARGPELAVAWPLAVRLSGGRTKGGSVSVLASRPRTWFEHCLLLECGFPTEVLLLAPQCLAQVALCVPVTTQGTAVTPEALLL